MRQVGFDLLGVPTAGGYGDRLHCWLDTPTPIKLLLAARGMPSGYTLTLIPVNYDSVKNMTYDGSGNLTSLEYWNEGVKLCTLTLTYDGSNLTQVVRS